MNSSLCLGDVAAARREKSLPADFLDPTQSSEIWRHLFEDVFRKQTYCWSQFQRHGLTESDAISEISRWPGKHVLVLFLDRADKRVLKVPLSWLQAFIDEFVYPSEDTYFLSEKQDRLAAQDHSQVWHLTSLGNGPRP